MRVVLKISYNGQNFNGWQIQPNKRTVQEILETELTKIIGENVRLYSSGRTDAKVSAIEQVAHFDCENCDVNHLAGRLKVVLPDDVKVNEVFVKEDFHSRFDAKEKTYFYNFYLSRYPNPYYDQIALHIGFRFDLDKVKESLQYIKGTHDFTCFTASGTDVEDKVRTITDIQIIDNPLGFYSLKITGTGFLYNMVRIIMGTLIEVGRGKIHPKEIIEIIESKDRGRSGKTVSPIGLVLKEVKYQ